VLGVLPGIIGALQANEVVKLLVGVGEPLVGRLVLFDALKLRFRELKLKKDPNCPVCSEHPTQTRLIDYEQFCGIAPEPEAVAGDDFNVFPEEVERWRAEGRDFQILDVRSPLEHEIAHIEGATLVPLQELRDRLGELDPAASLVVHCHHGPRSTQAVRFLRQMGYSRARNLAGGIDAWSREVDPSVPLY
jgi:adenylyltransferase/sulfurtransferase